MPALSPSRTDKQLLKTSLRRMDGTPWLTTFFDPLPFNRWPWIVERTCEEFDCTPEDVECIDHMTDPDDYEGPDAGRDKVSVRGKPVGYFA